MLIAIVLYTVEIQCRYGTYARRECISFKGQYHPDDPEYVRPLTHSAPPNLVAPRSPLRGHITLSTAPRCPAQRLANRANPRATTRTCLISPHQQKHRYGNTSQPCLACSWSNAKHTFLVVTHASDRWSHAARMSFEERPAWTAKHT